MEGNLWFVLVTIILQQPVLDGGSEKVGDVIQSSFIGASETKAQCEEAGKGLVKQFTEIGGGSVLVIYDCLEFSEEMSNTISQAQGFVSE